MRVLAVLFGLLINAMQVEAARVTVDYDFENKAFDWVYSNKSATEELERYLAGDLKRCKLNYVLGVFYATVSDPRARKFFNRAVDECPNHAPSYYQLGSLDLLGRDYGSAIINLQKALKLDSSMAAAYTPLATAYAFQGDKQAAYETLKKAIDNGIELDYIYYNASVAILYYHSQELKSAENYMQKAEKISPDKDQYPSLLGFIYLKQGLFGEALKEGEKTITLNKGNHLGYLLAISASRELKKYDDALMYAERLLLLRPDIREMEDEIKELKALQAQRE